jgi:hypothetical protein
MVYGARSGRLGARAERLLALLKLVDGPGSGLDADTVRGLAPEQLASLAADRVVTLEARIHELEARCASEPQQDDRTAALEARVRELETRLAAVSLGDDGRTLRFSGVNVQIVSGAGATDAAPNGLGNLIVGYNESRAEACDPREWACYDPYDDDRDGDPGDDRVGSHNLVVGQAQNYTSFGGIVTGQFNAIRAPFASVCGGAWNEASARHSSVSGGAHNDAHGGASSVSGGSRNVAAAELSWVGGGQDNDANGYAASVSGGEDNSAFGPSSSVSGGVDNVARGLGSTVSGGLERDAPGLGDWVAGGLLEDQ